MLLLKNAADCTKTHRKMSALQSTTFSALCDTFTQLILSFSYLYPWWNIIKKPKNDLNLNKLILADYLGYDENQFVFIQFTVVKTVQNSA